MVLDHSLHGVLDFVFFLFAAAITSALFDVPLPWKSVFVPTIAQMPPDSAPDNIRLKVRSANHYFRESTEGSQGTEKGMQDVNRRLIIKEALKSIRDEAHLWTAIVLEGVPQIARKTEASVFVLDVRDIEEHGTDYRKNMPLLQRFGWIERVSDGQLILMPIAWKEDETPRGLKLRLMLPELLPEDRIVFAVRRRDGARPAEFKDDSNVELVKE